MLVGICDFPSQYAFPPHGYGGIERWLWATAIGAAEAGADVHLIGPAWRPEAVARFPATPLRLEDLLPGSTDATKLSRVGLDLLVVGHEYPSLPAWRRMWEQLDCDVVTFQHDPAFRHEPQAFDGTRSRLFCYSGEMVERYASCAAIQTLSVQFGLDEQMPAQPGRGRDVIWLGRIDADKAPHLAALATARLGLPLTLVGPVLDETYVAEHAAALYAPHVTWAGELSGEAKNALLRDAAVFAYTCASGYIEAGAAVFGEALRAGVPVAALTWRPSTCAQAALCSDTGAIATADPAMSDDGVAAILASAIEQAMRLDRPTVQEIGLCRFDPAQHFRTLAHTTITSATPS
ncbi:glycosyltransferase [Actinomadura sp. 7K507]|uniref:glycosyltransferase n=1 Tax=Actinomadura sp. 7K507 TaxID=2530365 RepID=UPI0010479393|nr:glycosyltransferase [Actinomadura sp. 7K507]TDC96132.1 glycosyltransferase [Actinomadura sp. 7K507]